MPCSYVMMLGMAGSGKTTLTDRYSRWLINNGFNIAIVNLDPGVERVPYKPSFDIRDIITIRDEMIKYGLGPNGAFIKAMELIEENMDRILNSEPFINDGDYDLILIDTPGQMEVFVFRPVGPNLISKLRFKGFVIGVYIIDGEMIKKIHDAVMAWFMGLILRLRLGIPVIPILNKSDLTKDYEVVVKLINEPLTLINDLRRGLEGILDDVVEDMLHLVEKTRSALRFIKVSALTGEGIEDLHYIIHEVHCTCGDLT